MDDDLSRQGWPSYCDKISSFLCSFMKKNKSTPMYYAYFQIPWNPTNLNAVESVSVELIVDTVIGIRNYILRHPRL